MDPACAILACRVGIFTSTLRRMQVHYHRRDAFEALEVVNSRFTHRRDGGCGRHQRIERRYLLTRETGQHHAERIVLGCSGTPWD